MTVHVCECISFARLALAHLERNVCFPNQLDRNKHNWTVIETILLLVTENYQRSTVNCSVIFDNIYICMVIIFSRSEHKHVCMSQHKYTYSSPCPRDAPPYSITSPSQAHDCIQYCFCCSTEQQSYCSWFWYVSLHRLCSFCLYLSIFLDSS